MRKYVIGVVIGCCLSTAVSANAAVIEEMIGKTIEGVFPVKINGKQIDKQAVVIDGTSYLPVRAIGDALNLDVSFNADLGIGLTQKQSQAGGKMTSSQINSVIFQKVKILLDKVTSKENGEFGLYESDGNQYVSLPALSGPYKIDWKDPNATLRRDGSPDIVVAMKNEYQPNVDGFLLNGSAYVKLSLIGLKATSEEDSLIVTFK